MSAKKQVIKQFGKSLQRLNASGLDLYIWDISQKENQHNLVIWNPLTGKKQFIKEIQDSYYGINSNLIFTVSKVLDETIIKTFNVSSGKEKTLWREKCKSVKFSVSYDGTQAAFWINDSPDDLNQIYWINKSGVVKGFNFRTYGLSKEYIPKDIALNFDKSGKKLVFSVTKALDTARIANLPNAVSVDIWHYKDSKLQSEQLNRVNEARIEFAMLDLDKLSIHVFSLMPNEFYLSSIGNEYTDLKDYYLTKIILQTPSDRQIFSSNGSMIGRGTIFLKNIHYPITIPISKNSLDNVGPLSPNSKFVFYCDQTTKHCKCYNISQKKAQNIGDDLPPSAKNLIGWSENDLSIFVSDGYDIWEVDPLGLKRSRCITMGFGRTSRISLNIEPISDSQKNGIFKRSERVLVKGIQTEDYREGFTWIKLDNSNSGFKLRLQPYKNWSVQKIGDNYLFCRTNNKSAKTGRFLGILRL